MHHRLHTFVLVPVLVALSNLLFSSEIPESAIRESSRLLYENGETKRVYLQEPVDLDGVRFEGWTWFDSTGSLRHSELAEDLPFGDIVLPEGSTVFYEDGDIVKAWLAHDMDIDGLPIDGGGKIDTGFHPNKQLRVCFLRESWEIQGVIVKGGALTPVQFDEDGHLVNCTLAEDYLHDGSLWRAGTEVWLNPDGSVKQSYRPGWFARMGRGLLDVVF